MAIPSNRPTSTLRLTRIALLALTIGLVATILLQAPYAPAQKAVALQNGLALTPPMGWNSWYGLGCDVDEASVENVAYGMVVSGMSAAGYTYVNVDDCWQGSRTRSGSIRADSTRFPDGLPAVIQYVHSLGLKFGLYTDAGSETCTGKPGSFGYEQRDADTYAQWGVDFVKVDWCHSDGLDPAMQYKKMSNALTSASQTYHHAIVFSICDWGVDSPWAWGPNTGNMWRTAGDIGDPTRQWTKVLSNLDLNAAHAAVAHPGAWNDPDMLQVGLGTMSDVEDRSQFSLWAMMAAPLLVSNDLGNMSDTTQATLTNPDVIAIDQDPAGVQGTIVKQDGSGQLQIWSKPLSAPNTWAVALFNRSDDDATMQVDWSDVGVQSSSVSARDVWAGTPATPADGGYATTVPSHGVALLIVTADDTAGQ